MKIKELIEELKKYPPDYEVFIQCPELDDDMVIKEVDERVRISTFRDTVRYLIIKAEVEEGD